MKPIAEILAENVKRLRKERGLTQEALAESAKTGDDKSLSFRTIQQIEYGERWPGPETVAALAEALGVQQDALFIEKKAGFGAASSTPRTPSARDAAELLALWSDLPPGEADHVLETVRVLVGKKKGVKLAKGSG